MQLLVLILIASGLFFIHLGDLGLGDPGEGSHAEAARHIHEEGNGPISLLNDPPSLATRGFWPWVIGAAYHLAGVSPLGARLPSAVCGMLLLMLHYGFVRDQRGAVPAALSSVMLLLNVGMIAAGRLGVPSSALILCTAVALYGFWWGLHGERWRRHVRWAFERSAESHVPLSFWYLSLGGGLITLAYAVYRRDPVIIAGQAIGTLMYVRNLMLVRRSP